MKRVHVFIDGFNMYHPLEEYRRHTGENLKWLNYRSLMESLASAEEIVTSIHFFTAIDEKRPDDVIQRHHNYIGALKTQNIEVYRGVFKHRKQTCKSCHYTREKPVEKETDVRIACKILEFAMKDLFDEFWLVSGDSDFVPVIQSFKSLFPHKTIKVIIPPKYNQNGQYGNPYPAKTFAKSKKSQVPTHQLGFSSCSKHPLADELINPKGKRFKNPYLQNSSP
jgi:uncharacterized LabA/DUF88 family protein